MLLAEDDPTTHALLSHLLEQWGYEVVAVHDGTAAIAALDAQDAPRLAVLDLNMPGLSGIEICRQLKQREMGRLVYCIVITSATDPGLISEVLDSGALDFLYKPIQPDALKSRLGVGCRVLDHIERLTRSNEALGTHSAQLAELAANREKQLMHADRMATLGLLSASVAHEINNPATFISGNAQALAEFWPEVERVIRGSLGAAGEEERRKLEFVLEEAPRALESMQNGVKRIASIVRGLKSYSRHGPREKLPCDVNRCIESALALCAHELRKREVEVQCEFGADLPTAHADAQQIEQVIVNLCVNAAQAMQKSAKRLLTLGSSRTNRGIRVTVDDTGVGVPPAILDRIWLPFFTTKPSGEGTGLGLSICRDIIKDHDGELKAQNRPEGGARFIVEIPC